MRRSPCEFYLKYLLVHPDGLSNEAIEARARKEQLDIIDYSYLDDLRRHAVPPVPFYPADPNHFVSQKFLLREGIRRLFHPDDSVRVARRLLAAPRAKEFVEAMLIHEAPNHAIASKISGQYGVPCTPEGVEAFRIFFWNLNNLDRTELRVLLRMRHVAPPPRDPADPKQAAEATHRQKALEKAYYKDARRLAADLPHSPLSALVTEMYMGFSPAKIDRGKILQVLQDGAMLRIAEEMGANDKGASGRAFDWSIVMKNVTDVMESTISPEATLQDQIQALRLKTRPSSAPVIHQLTGGQHTMDLQPAPEAEQEAVDEPADRETTDPLPGTG